MQYGSGVGNGRIRTIPAIMTVFNSGIASQVLKEGGFVSTKNSQAG